MLGLGNQLEWFFKWTKLYKEEQSTKKEIDKLGESVIAEKEKIYAENPDIFNTPDEDAPTKPQILINQLYKSRNQLTEDRILVEINTLLMTVCDEMDFGRKL
jgi:hypothetical protein